jgi:hypothetical protein
MLEMNFDELENIFYQEYEKEFKHKMLLGVLEKSNLFKK